jgi:phytoene synthase
MAAPTSLAPVLKRVDNDRYLASLFAPVTCREAIFALYAFNHEIAKTSEVVSEATLGEIRLQWWRDAIAQLFSQDPGDDQEPPEHEVLAPLADLLARRRFSQQYFEQLIDARRRDLDLQPFATLKDLEAYLEASGAPLLYLALEMAAGNPAEQPDAAQPAIVQRAAQRAARHVALAYGLSGSLRALPYQARRKRCLLPEDHMIVAQVDRADLFDLKGSDQLDGVVMRLAQRAAEHLAEARKVTEELPLAARRVLLPARLAERNLSLLRRHDYDVFSLDGAALSPASIFALAWSAWRHRY